MDTSKEYIKMCEEAEEIQERWTWIKGDVFADEINQIHILESGGHIMLMGTHFPEGYIWLPRQDQLQEIVDYDNNPYVLNSEFMDFINVENEIMCAPREPIMNSMEQLWLAFVMKEKYNKKWNNKELKWQK